MEEGQEARRCGAPFVVCVTSSIHATAELSNDCRVTDVAGCGAYRGIYLANNATDSSSSPVGSLMCAFNLSPRTGSMPGAANLSEPAEPTFTSRAGRWGE